MSFIVKGRMGQRQSRCWGPHPQWASSCQHLRQARTFSCYWSTDPLPQGRRDTGRIIAPPSSSPHSMTETAPDGSWGVSASTPSPLLGTWSPLAFRGSPPHMGESRLPCTGTFLPVSLHHSPLTTPFSYQTNYICSLVLIAGFVSVEHQTKIQSQETWLIIHSFI